MIKLSYMEILNPRFRQAADVIWNSPQLDGQTSYSAHRIKKGIDKVLKNFRQQQEELALGFAKSTEVDGKKILHRDPNGNLMFDGSEQQEGFEKKFEEVFSEKYLELQVTKIDFEKLKGVRGLTPSHWEFLQPIVENFPPEEEEPSEPAEIPSSLIKP